MNRLALIALVRKDLLEFITDRRSLIMAAVAPILLASFMAVVLGGTSGGGSEAARVDHDSHTHTLGSRRL
jgi:ABC-2 type transport system permease protein